MNSFKDFVKKSVLGRLRGNEERADQVYDKYVLQFRRPGTDGECDLIIGLDFGTSASKVVIQAPYLQGSPTFAVDFGQFAHRSMPFLLPSVLWVDRSGFCRLSGEDGATHVRDIKLELFSSPDLAKSKLGPSHYGLQAEQVASAYLSLILRYARIWFLESQQNLISHFSKLVWSVNLGVPSPCVEDNEDNLRFRRIGKSGWMLSVLHADVTLELAQKELTLLDENPAYWDNDPEEVVCNLDIVPEIAAGAVGYAMSDLRREGAHVMIDVGASTLDVCSFILRQSDQDRYSLLTADVKQLGTIKLHHARIEAIQHAFERQAQKLIDKHDPLTPLADGIDSYLLPEDEIRREVSLAEEAFQKDCLKMIKTVIHDMRTRRAPNEDVWRRKLPILLIGGGSKSPFYEAIARSIDDWARDLYQNEGVSLQQVPVPKSLKLETSEYHRLAVAWGLSHQSFDIGEIIPADRIKDIDPPTKRKWEDSFISKDQV
jgi:hypothetical protein